MRALVVFIVMINLFGCAGTVPSHDAQSVANSTTQTVLQAESNSSDTAKPLKSPHGYIIDKDYELGRFGGFVGDCTDDKNWPHFWRCQSENSGNGGFH
jgi:hypothetical protein